MDFDEMRAACQRATSSYVADSVDDFLNCAPQVDDLKKRLRDKHTVTYDPICDEAAAALEIVELRLRKNQMMSIQMLQMVATAVSCLQSATKFIPAEFRSEWDDAMWPMLMSVMTTFSAEE